MSVAAIKHIVNNTSGNLSMYSVQYKNVEQVLPFSSLGNKNIHFPWVGNINEFADRVLVFEIVGKMRFYIWDTDWRLYYYQSPEFLEGPFTGSTKVTLRGNEWYRGSLIPGDFTKDHTAKEIIFSQKGNHYTVMVRNY